MRMLPGRFTLKRLLPVVCVLLLLTLVVACDGSPKAPKATLHYFTWSDYVGEDLLREFERQHDVKVVVDTFSSNEELLAKLQSGATGYDVTVPSDFMVSIMVKEGLLAELDLSLIPNAGLIMDRFQRIPADPDHQYSVPYLWGTVGIGYDSAVLTTAPDSWGVLWDAQFKGRISMLNDQRELFAAALRATGHSINARDIQSIEQAKVKLINQKPLVRTYTSERYDQLLVSGEVILAHGWGGSVARAMAERPSIQYVIPKEGSTIWADCLVVLKTSAQKGLATAFINYLLDPHVAARTTERVLFASVSRQAKDLVSAKVRNNPAIYPPDALLDRLEWMTDVGEAIHLYDRAWTELKLR
jgi:spermidine/putrescine transport system substrate-binding protein